MKMPVYLSFSPTNSAVHSFNQSYIEHLLLSINLLLNIGDIMGRKTDTAPPTVASERSSLGQRRCYTYFCNLEHTEAPCILKRWMKERMSPPLPFWGTSPVFSVSLCKTQSHNDKLDTSFYFLKIHYLPGSLKPSCELALVQV